ncbi:MAG TPA: hypothetical protein VJR89_30000 [Polyangiales bacterium]|nr:hypothetical protein [Polyangiales bacterium]
MQREAPAAETKPAVPAAESAPPPMAASARARFRVAKRSGDARTGSLPLGTSLETPAKAELTVDLANGARLTLGPESRALLLDAVPGAVVLLSGRLHAQLLPQGQLPDRAPLRIVLDGQTLAVPEAGELWVARPKAAASSYVAVLAGSAEREQRESEALGRRTLIAGQDLLGSAPARRAGPRTLEQAEQAYERVRAKLGAPLGGPGEPLLARAIEAFDAAERRARELGAAQRAAKQRGESAAVAAAQRELVELAQHKVALRQELRFAFELAASRVLDAGDAGAIERFRDSYAERAAAVMPSGS